MASEAEILGEGMRRTNRSFEQLLEEKRFGYMLSGLIVGFDYTCATLFHIRSKRHPCWIFASIDSFSQDADVPRDLSRSR